MREPAKNPRAAQRRYTDILGRSLSCLTRTAVWYVGPTVGAKDENDLGLSLSTDPVALKRGGDLPKVLFSATQRFSLIPDERYAGEWKARTLAYVYSVQVASGDELISWEWHPLTTPGREAPHVHVRLEEPRLGTTLSKLHLPTGRVSFEEIVEFLFADMAVCPARDDWPECLGESRARFEAFRTWPASGQAPGAS